MDTRADRRSDPGGEQQPVAHLDGDWLIVTWADSHWALRVTDGEADEYATSHGPACAICRAHAQAQSDLDALLPPGQPEGRA